MIGYYSREITFLKNFWINSYINHLLIETIKIYNLSETDQQKQRVTFIVWFTVQVYVQRAIQCHARVSRRKSIDFSPRTHTISITSTTPRTMSRSPLSCVETISLVLFSWLFDLIHPRATNCLCLTSQSVSL